MAVQRFGTNIIFNNFTVNSLFVIHVYFYDKISNYNHYTVKESQACANSQKCRSVVGSRQCREW